MDRCDAMINTLSISKNKFIDYWTIFSLSFFYAVGALWSGSVFSSDVTRYLWIVSMILILLAIILKQNGSFPFPKKINFYQFCILFFAGFSLLSRLWASNASRAFSRAIFVTEIVISMVFISILFKLNGCIRILLKSIEIGGYFAVMFLIYSNGISNMISFFRRGSRLTYTGVNSNTIGIIAAFSFVISIYFIATEGIHLVELFSIPSAFIVILSVSKKAYAISFFGIGFYFLVNSVKSKNLIKNIINISLTTIVIAVFFYFVLQLPVMDRFKTRLSSMVAGFVNGVNSKETDISTYERILLQQAGIEIIKDHPILGVGLDNARLFNSFDAYLHNNYLEIFADLGIIGLIIYYLPFIFFTSRFIKYREFAQSEYSICLSLLLIFLVMDLGRVSYYNVSTYYFMLLFYLKSVKLVQKSYIAE